MPTLGTDGGAKIGHPCCYKLSLQVADGTSDRLVRSNVAIPHISDQSIERDEVIWAPRESFHELEKQRVSQRTGSPMPGHGHRGRVDDWRRLAVIHDESGTGQIIDSRG